MKRVRNVYPTLISDENLKFAIMEVCRTHRWDRHHRRNPIVMWIESDIPSRVDELRKIIESGYEPSPVEKIHIYDHSAGKWRDICKPLIWPDQCVHHAVIQVLEPVFMRGMDRWCCGSIRKRGIHYGAKGIKKWMDCDKKGTKYCAELDIRHFYDSITPAAIMARFRMLIKDRKMLSVIECVMTSGILIGCYYSQWFANVLLQPLDHALRELEFGVTHYIRYMDNLTIFASNKRRLSEAIRFVDNWLRSRSLRLKGNWQKFPTKSRLPNALGYRFGRGYTLLRKRNVLKLKRKLHKAWYRIVREKKVSPRLAAGIISMLGQLRHCNSMKLRSRILWPKAIRYMKNVVREERKKWNIHLESSVNVNTSESKVLQTA